ncbi:MAG: pyruvate:ferredoxin (flavodoxin) oxidoreductase [Thermoguttaceae bacterium]|nr:pyruvate:ferredoxin (flavodoxin) oxidoreductase [Thermoguttaceae bacterium]
MAERVFRTVDGVEATANIAHLCNEVMAIYPITPSSGLGELPDAWAANGRKNIFGSVPHVVEMQSEAGAAGAVHGSLQAGALTSTFTASQGLLLMIPNMFKIAGELTSTVFHVTARTVATHALSIFGDHSDIMACRSTGWAILGGGSVEESQDFALIAQAATLEARVPMIHTLDGFRISHEINKIEQISDDDVKSFIPMDLVAAYRARALSPEHPVIRGTAQNPDVFFQAREACNGYYERCCGVIQKWMDKFAEKFGRSYHLFDYFGAADAEQVIVAFGSGCGVVEEYVDHAKGAKIGLVKVRVYRPFDMAAFCAALPKTVKRVVVLDRTKEPGAGGEPLYLDVVSAIAEKWEGAKPDVIGGRYGLSCKEFTPAMVKSVYEEAAKDQPKRRFVVGICDDVLGSSLDYDESFTTEADDVKRSIFYGLGSDGTVSANKSSVKILGETGLYAQGYFVYDSRKAGSMTTSHVRFSPRPIKGSYLIHKANFVACHQFHFLERVDMLSIAEPGATFLLNSPYSATEVWDHLPQEVQKEIIGKKINFWVVDAYGAAREANMGVRINTIMQTCFFQLANILPAEEAIAQIKKMIYKTYAKKGDAVVEQNYKAVDAALSFLAQVSYPDHVTAKHAMLPPVPADAPKFVKEVLGEIIANRGDQLPVSKFVEMADGTFPTATTQYEKRSIAQDIPVWNPSLCLQCGQCAMVCPHAAIRMNVYDANLVEKAPKTFKSVPARNKDFAGMNFTLQTYPDDCTGCGLCVSVCPAKDKADATRKAINMELMLPIVEQERENLAFYQSLPAVDRSKVKMDTMVGSQLLQPLFEFSGACAGCGETPYIKLVTQFFGDRMMVANATGCSSIYGGNLPCTPYAKNAEGKGPAWANSLFEDNAEFGMGMRLACDQQKDYATVLLQGLAPLIGDELVKAILDNPQKTDAEIAKQRELIATLVGKLATLNTPEAAALAKSAEHLIRRSVWCFGGDGWAYDIGFGGLDHVFASGRDMNIMVLDTEVYSNTGGQSSKATPRGAQAKFAMGGKPSRKKDLGMIAMSYGNVFVGQISIGANPLHALKTIRAAEAYEGTSLIIALSHCIAWTINLSKGLEFQKEAVATGYWPLYSYDPREAQPFRLASKAPTGGFRDFALKQGRFNNLHRAKPVVSDELLAKCEEDINTRWTLYSHMAAQGE